MVPNIESDYVLFLGYRILYKEYYLTRLNHQKKHYSCGVWKDLRSIPRIVRVIICSTFHAVGKDPPFCLRLCQAQQVSQCIWGAAVQFFGKGPFWGESEYAHITDLCQRCQLFAVLSCHITEAAIVIVEITTVPRMIPKYQALVIS